MKTSIKPVLLLLIALTAPLLLSSCSEDVNPVASTTSDSITMDILSIEDFPVEPVSDEEANGLIFMREEEKLARDVYATLYTQWGQRIFSNISASESTHTNTIKTLLDRYELTDPVGQDIPGEFNNSTLASLYSTLVETGGQSIIEALQVGAVIEEIDILDLKEQLDTVVDNADIQFVYENLLRGSGNHLRAFVRNLQRQGIVYVPQYMDETLYNEIISSSSENGRTW
ncbi:DUF2202 domain-containing protein [bacterium]|nr:DUF2202 domain-containing protein [bacterium]